MPEKNVTTSSKMSSNKCSCCPYGFHIDRDFVRYCDSLYNSAQLDKLRQHKRERRKEKKSVESYLGLVNLSLERKKNLTPIIVQNVHSYPYEKFSTELYLNHDDLKNAVNDFEDTWKKSLKKSFSTQISECRDIKQPDCSLSAPCTAYNNSLSSVNSEDAKEIKVSCFQESRSSSSSSVSSQSTTQSNTGVQFNFHDSSNSFPSGLQSLSSLSKAVNIVPHQTVGINKSVLSNIREQMASSLHRMKELEEQVKSIPNLKDKISLLAEEKESLMKKLKLNESTLIKAKSSNKCNKVENQLKKLENEGIMSPTLSRKCISLQHSKSEKLFSPAVTTASDSTNLKTNSTKNDLISHLKISEINIINISNSKKSIGTSCTVLTRDIGIGSVPSRSKSIAVGDDFSQNYCSNLYKKNIYDKQSVSSGSLESDLDSLSGIGDIPIVSSHNDIKRLALNELIPNKNSTPKTFKNSCTNTEFIHIDKCVNTEKDLTGMKKAYIFEKSLRHKSISVTPTVRNKYIQASEQLKTRDIGSQTSEVILNKIGVLSTLLNTCDVGVGDFFITDVVCDKCKKIKKSIGIGDCDINKINCLKCSKYNKTFKYTSKGVGDIDINLTCFDSSHNETPKTKVFSTGTNTTFKHNQTNRNIFICDKCSKTIHSVAQDFVADCKETTLINSNSSMVQTSEIKISELKPQVTPLTIIETSTDVKSFTSVKKTKDENKIIHKPNTTEEKGNGNLSIDSDETSNKYSSSENLPTFTNLPVLPRKKHELNKEIRAACKVLNDHLQKSDRGNEKKMLSSLKIIQTEWFKAANQKKTDPHLIEDYIDTFEEFSKLLLHKIVNLSDTNGNTSLHYAVSYGNFDVVSILIDSKVCDVNLKNKAGYTSIMLVALAEMRNDTHHYVVQKLFSIGDINIKATQNGQTALMLAVSHGKKDIVKILLDVGAEINLQDKDGSTALMCAAEHGHLEIAKILLSHAECDPTIVDNDGCTALTIAMEAGNKDIGLLIYTNMNFSRGSSPYSTLKPRKRSTPRSTPPPHTPTLRTPPPPSPGTKSMNSLLSFHFS